MIEDSDWLDRMNKFGKLLEAQVEQTKKILYKCPKSDKCVMDCHHRVPHKRDKYCRDQKECPSCVEEIKADITFFPEDFEIE